MDNKRTCCRCKKVKELQEFKRSNKTCIRCSAQTSLSRAWRPKREWHTRTKYRATRLSIPFNLTAEDFIMPNICPILKIPLDGRDVSHEPTLDRVIPELGYVKGNVNVISHKANRLKNNATIDELLSIIKYLRQNGINTKQK